MDKNTIQIRIDRKLHKQLKYRAINNEKTITLLASQMILYCLANRVNFYDELETIEVPEELEDNFE